VAETRYGEMGGRSRERRAARFVANAQQKLAAKFEVLSGVQMMISKLLLIINSSFISFRVGLLAGFVERHRKQTPISGARSTRNGKKGMSTAVLRIIYMNELTVVLRDVRRQWHWYTDSLFVVHGFNGTAAPGQLKSHHLVDHDSQGEDVGFKRIIFAFEYLWSHPTRSSNDTLSLFNVFVEMSAWF